jgi:hypothetical protein
LPLVVGIAVIALAVGIAGFVYSRSASSTAGTSADASQAVPIADNLKPHPQANLPALNFPGYPMARSREVVTAAYKFAAEHPEVLSYVPCFCGCERQGHRGNEDCFVKARDVNGDVVEWEDHGMECAVCLDVATRAQQLYASGASVADIQSTIEKQFGARAITHTPTPPAPHHQ